MQADSGPYRRRDATDYRLRATGYFLFSGWGVGGGIQGIGRGGVEWTRGCGGVWLWAAGGWGAAWPGGGVRGVGLKFSRAPGR